jgi:hypothetical protein
MRVVWFIAILAVMAIGSLLSDAYARRSTQEKEKKTEETYTRPKPTRPIKPEIPSANRYRTDKVFLENADSLYTLPNLFANDVEHQIVKGSVKFRQAGMFMYCDSAYYYPDMNSLDAFGHVRMEQGDTLFVYADKLFYNGNERRARLRCGATERTVRLINRNVTLVTDSLDYDLAAEMGWYDNGGKIDDKVNTLTSKTGIYSPSTKEAEFYYDVVLVNNKDGYRMLTDTLFYNTSSHIARIVTPTVIEGANDTIITSLGNYNTVTDEANLMSRSTIAHKDSNNNVVTLEGDSIIYDKRTRISRAFMSSLPTGRPMVLTDTANHTKLIGGFGLYNDSTREAYATDYPLLIEYSRPDTIFLRADTIKTYIETRKVMPKLPPVVNSSATVDRMPLDSVTIEGDSIGLDSDSIPPVVPKPSLIAEVDSSLMVDKEFHVAQAFRRARFFRTDIQGIADSITYVEFDSILYMHRKPIVWADKRQVTGDQINVHFNDSTADWAYLPLGGMSSEYVDEDFYNQLTGKQMRAYLKNQQLERLEVDGNVRTIVLPVEKDSTYNKLVNAEGAHMTVDMKDGAMDKIKMWPDVSGVVIPTFLVKNADKYLPGFQWFEKLRPVRQWYGDQLKWEDELGELPDELEQYFASVGSTKSTTKNEIGLQAEKEMTVTKKSVSEQEIQEVESVSPGQEAPELEKSLEL